MLDSSADLLSQIVHVVTHRPELADQRRQVVVHFGQKLFGLRYGLANLNQHGYEIAHQQCKRDSHKNRSYFDDRHILPPANPLPPYPLTPHRITGFFARHCVLCS